MKVIQELPLSLFYSLKYSITPANYFVKNSKPTVPIIISLTSIPSRLGTLHLTIRSLLNQDARPKKIILWLHHSLKNEIPKKLATLESDLFEIMYSDLTCSHRKLIHSLELFPNDIIVTCDDDMLYRPNWLRLLHEEHQSHPKKIIANQTRYIRYNNDGELQSYKSWVFDENLKFRESAVIPIGAEGVLYPPKSLSEKVTDSTLFLELAPKADDLWFKAMAYLKGTVSLQAKNKAKTPIPIIGSQKQSLKKSNIGGDKNKTQWLALTNYFNITPNNFL